MRSTRGEDGTFAYGFRGAGAPPQFSVGRSPLCELSLLLTGGSDQERLAHAIELSFEHHPVLEKIRKYDDHADRHGYGGFFFWFDMLGRTEATLQLTAADARQRLAKAQRDLVLQLPEFDGGFVDSHELGRGYGTAMALLCLHALRDAR